MKEIVVEARGLGCPIPVVHTIKAIGELSAPGVIETHVDNAVAVENLLMMAKNKGLTASKRTEGEKHFVVRIEVTAVQGSGERAGGESAEGASEDVSQYTCSASNEDIVAVFPSEFMGSGSDELGAILIKGFIYTLTQIETKPGKVIFYNSGVKLAVEGSQLEDLKKLEEEGVEIMSCGTCLDFYGLKDRLAVGTVSNMYAIADVLSRASKVLRP